MIDLRRLRVLRVLADQGTVVATARTLHLTPSAVSQQLALLARDVGVDLLVREGRTVRLTPAALVLLDHADALSEYWERAHAEVIASGEGDAGPLGLCGLSSVLATLIAPAATILRESRPEMTVRISEHETVACYEMLLTGESDIAVVLPTQDAPAAGDPRFTRRALLDDPQDLLVPEGHPLARRRGVELSEAAEDEWIVKPVDNDSYGLVLAACAAAGFAPRIAHHAKEWFAVSALVAEGFGVCLIPRIVPLPAEHAVVRVPLRGTPAPSRRFLTVVRRGSEKHPAIAAGMAALREARDAVDV